MSQPPQKFTTAPEFIAHLQTRDENSHKNLVTDLFNKMLDLQSETEQLNDELANCRLQVVEANVIVTKLNEEVSNATKISNEYLQACAVSDYKLSLSEQQVKDLRHKLSDQSGSSDPESHAGVQGRSELFRIDDRFTGEDKSLYPSFQRQIRIALSRNRDRYDTLQSKITLVYQNLGPGPKSFLDRYLSDSGDFQFATLEAVWEVLDVSYKNVNEEEEALEALNQLEQGGRSFGWFLAEFQRLYNMSGISDDKMLISMMRNGVSDELRARISAQQDIHKKYTFDEYVSLCKDCVVRLNLEKSSRSKNPIQSFFNPTPRGTNLTPRGYNPTPPHAESGASVSSGANSVPLGGDPMILDQSDMSHLGPDGHLTPQERQRRFRFKLCMRCGKPGHRAGNCRGKGKQHVVQELMLENEEPEEDHVSSDPQSLNA